MNIILDKYEQELQDSIERGEWAPIENFNEELDILQKAALNSNQIRLDIELESNDLERIKNKAQTIGIPYKTLIKSVLHYYAKV